MAKIEVKINEEMIDAFKNVPNPFKDLHEAKNKLREAVQETIPLMQQFNKDLHPLFIGLVRHGWYINGAGMVGELVKIKTLISASDIEGINKLMIDQLDSTYQSLKRQTLEMFESKKDILGRAFTAFENFQYEYAILILLTQTDSICKHLTESRLFGRDKKVTKTKKFADEHYNETSFASALLQPLTDSGEINKAEFEYSPGEFNRHKIIHGEDIDFGTKINMYKMLSLIFYLTTIVRK